MAKLRNSGLERIKSEFKAWRKTRVRGTRIPERLWAAAMKVSEEIGVYATARSLNLDYYTLQRRLHEQSQKLDASAHASTVSKSPSLTKASGSDTASVDVPGFIELTPASMAAIGECVIEWEDGAGARTRLCLKGTDLSNIAQLGQSLGESLGRSFWSGK